MGCWLLNLLFALIGILVIDNWFAKTRQKIPYYVVLAVIFFSSNTLLFIDWKKHTLVSYELTQDYLVLHYLTGQTEHIAYQDVEKVKYYVVGKGNVSCGLSFYIKRKDNIRTLSDFRCQQIGELKHQIEQHVKKSL